MDPPMNTTTTTTTMMPTTTMTTTTPCPKQSYNIVFGLHTDNANHLMIVEHVNNFTTILEDFYSEDEDVMNHFGGRVSNIVKSVEIDKYETQEKFISDFKALDKETKKAYKNTNIADNLKYGVEDLRKVHMANTKNVIILFQNGSDKTGYDDQAAQGKLARDHGYLTYVIQYSNHPAAESAYKLTGERPELYRPTKDVNSIRKEMNKILDELVKSDPCYDFYKDEWENEEEDE
ncbi:hypothetical protein L596_022643 [Steinernema carpocapsae]|uniref:Uncharacterized protein n=1 Tax=Steinernema carpocapsae TaxID=34508 RepID=A0A4U5MNC9_STECR|nr:hypothetical protein L596_022643 [Steinernema carpocapsae]